MRSFPISSHYAVEFDASLDLLWSTWLAGCPAYFSPALLDDMDYGLSTIRDGSFVVADQFRYFVLRSRRRNIFSLGGDLDHFRQLVAGGQKERLLAYARQSSSMMYDLHTGLGKGVTTIALVQGKCFGGGLEVAVACDYIVAERHSQFGFPEVQLGIYPGMGALPILARRLSKRHFETLCHSGCSFSAEDMAEMGLVDLITDTGQGEQVLLDWIRRRRSAMHAHEAMSAIRKSATCLSLAELQAGLEPWVDTVMALDRRRLALLSLAIDRQRVA